MKYLLLEYIQLESSNNIENKSSVIQVCGKRFVNIYTKTELRKEVLERRRTLHKKEFKCKRKRKLLGRLPVEEVLRKIPETRYGLR